MFEVVLTLCMLVNPSQCETHNYGKFPHELECYARAQSVIAEQVDLRNWSVKKWGCKRYGY